MSRSPKQWIILFAVLGSLGAVTTAVVLSMDAPVPPNATPEPPVPPEEVALHGREHPNRLARRGLEDTPTITADTLDGIVALHDTGDHENSLRVLREWLPQHADHPDVPWATALLGVWQSQAGHHEHVVATLENAVLPAIIQDVTLSTLAGSLRALGRPEDAVKPLTEILAYARSPLAPQAEFDRADALFEATRHERALRRYKEGLKHYPAYPRRWNVRHRMAICLERLGRTKEAITNHRRIRREVPESQAGVLATQALERLRKAGHAIPAWKLNDDIEWATTLRKSRRWADALERLDALVPRLSARADKAKVHWQRAKALESLERFDESLNALDTAKSVGYSGRRIRRARVKILQRQGKTKQAAREARRLERQRDEAEKVAAKLLREGGLFKRAAALFRRHLDPEHKLADAWLTSWLHYQTGRLNNAETGFRQLALRTRSVAQKARYWLGRTQQRRKRLQQAQESFQTVASANPRSYYGLQAINRLLDMGQDDWVIEHTGAVANQLPSADDRKTGQARVHWLSVDGSTLPPTRPVRAPNRFDALTTPWVSALPELKRASVRYRLGLDELARHELRIALSEYKRTRKGRARILANQPTSLYVDHRTNRSGLWGSSLDRSRGLGPKALDREIRRIETLRGVSGAFRKAAYTLLGMAGDPWGQRKKAFADHARLLRGVPTPDTNATFRAGFPFPYETTLREETQRYGLSLYLMSAVARVESAFNALAISTANARGLVQVLPVTGNLIARERKHWEFSAEDLLRPEVSIQYGTWYMNELLKKFHGQEALAIASYNAGPHRMAEWLRLRGKNTALDEFIEDIPYRQARRYVKRVLSLIGLYRRIYENCPVLYIGNRMDTKYEDNINW